MAAVMNFGMSGATREELPPGVKRCPRCGETLFDDMSVCYGCLYDFEREPYRPPEGLDVTPLSSPSARAAHLAPEASEAAPSADADATGDLAAAAALLRGASLRARVKLRPGDVVDLCGTRLVVVSQEDA